MNSQEFQKTILSATDKYYNYLTTANGGAGCVVITVLSFSRITPASTDFQCYLHKPLLQLDTCEVFVRGVKTTHVTLLRCGKDNHGSYIILRALKNTDKFSELKPSDITIRSDLTFLLKRLEKFYRDTDLNFSPPASELLPPHSYPVRITPSEEQEKAVNGALSNPISYIWGPPGTGKTNVVLAECLLRYIRTEKRVFLLAPTNNAVEQMLRGILPILRDAGIDLHKVYRLGIATGRFAQEFPQVIGSSDLELEQLLLKEEKTKLQSELEKVHVHEQTVQRNRERLTCLKRLADIIDSYYAKALQHTSLRHTLDEKQLLLDDLSRKCTVLDADFEAVNTEFSQCSFAIEETKRQLRRLRFRFHHAEQRRQLTIALAELFTLRETLRTSIKQTNNALLDAKDEKHLQTHEINKIRDRLVTITSGQKDLLAPVFSSNEIPSQIKSLFQNLPQTSFEDSKSKFSALLQEISHQNKQYEASLPRSRSEIEADLAQIEEKLLALSKNNKLSQLENALIVAGTVHSSLRQLSEPSGKKISHIFLDEAGYTSLAYGMIAFACNCPVTFLGDHLQLSPICEMKRIGEENEEVSLFSLPCAYLSELFDLPMYDLYRLYFDINLRRPIKDVSPSFTHLSMFPLSISYRFHDSLADILSRHIYPMRFYGKAHTDFEIVVIDAPNRFSKAQNNASPPEADAVLEYLISSNISLIDNFVILTPYRNQVDLLKKTIPSCATDHIFTVHRSQGMEFDTVILSVVDKVEAFFSNSRSPLGRSVLNTAISRAKKKLVLVCDVSFWSEQEGQLISDLIHSGNPFLFLL